MRAIQVSRFGGPEVLQLLELPVPVPGPKEAVIDVSAADILFVETQIRTGWRSDYFGLRPPYVPGFGVAGRVRAVGEEVDVSWIGRRVAANTERRGGCAEQALVGADRLIAMPQGLSDREAAVLLHDGATAYSVFDAAKVTSDKCVLVLAAAGGLGGLLVQLAHAAGARVIAAARGEAKLELAKSLGADETVDYSNAGWIDRVRALTDGKGPDVVFDGAGGAIGEAAFAVTASGGQFSSHGAASGGFAVIDAAKAAANQITLRGIQDARRSNEESKRWIAMAFADTVAGKIRPVIGATFPLEEAAEAHAAIGRREILGRVLLVL